MSDDNTLNFEEHRRKREQNRDLVPCPKCKKPILATSIRCPECGVHFDGEAYDFAPEQSSPVRLVVVVIAVLLILATLLTALGIG
jgi:ribosomal protein L37AE/L43A